MAFKGNFYYVYGDDTDMIEKKYLPDLANKFQGATWLRYDASIDDIQVGKLTTEYNSNGLFDSGKVICVRNADDKAAQVETLAGALLESPNDANALILIGKSLNGVTKLGKLVKKHFISKEFSKPEIKPFDLLDALNCKSSSKVILQSEKLFAENFNPLGLYSLLCGHFILLKQVKERQGQNYQNVARELKQHQFRIKKMMVANRYWELPEIDAALKDLKRLGDLLRTWQYDEKMLIQMMLIKLCS